jgi:hypothetical protein
MVQEFWFKFMVDRAGVAAAPLVALALFGR